MTNEVQNTNVETSAGSIIRVSTFGFVSYFIIRIYRPLSRGPGASHRVALACRSISPMPLRPGRATYRFHWQCGNLHSWPSSAKVFLPGDRSYHRLLQNETVRISSHQTAKNQQVSGRRTSHSKASQRLRLDNREL